MYYIGFDIAKLDHFASALSSNREILVKPFKLSNDNGGFCKLLPGLDLFEPNSFIIVFLSTARHDDKLVEFPSSRHFHFASLTKSKHLRLSHLLKVSCHGHFDNMII
ncbi:MAG: hypothetical protein ACOYJO_01760 [Eubacterium sp.]|jgi:transposase